MVLTHLESHGLTCTLDARRLGIQPARRLTPALVEFVRANRQDIILRLLEQPPLTEAERQLEADERDAIQREHQHATEEPADFPETTPDRPHHKTGCTATGAWRHRWLAGWRCRTCFPPTDERHVAVNRRAPTQNPEGSK